MEKIRGEVPERYVDEEGLTKRQVDIAMCSPLCAAALSGKRSPFNTFGVCHVPLLRRYI